MAARNLFCNLLAVGVTGMLLSGCSGRPGRLSPPDVDADEAAAAAIVQLDRDADGQLNSEELTACPALVNALPAYDADGDGALTEKEIAGGIGDWTKSQVGAMPLPFSVTLDGRPLAGAEIKLIPLEFMDGAVKPAEGVANRGGGGFLGMSADNRPANAPNVQLVQPGLYRVEITHPTVEVPAKFNAATTLGLETAVAARNPSGVIWSLKSK